MGDDDRDFVCVIELDGSRGELIDAAIEWVAQSRKMIDNTVLGGRALSRQINAYVQRYVRPRLAKRRPLQLPLNNVDEDMNRLLRKKVVLSSSAPLPPLTINLPSAMLKKHPNDSDINMNINININFNNNININANVNAKPEVLREGLASPHPPQDETAELPQPDDLIIFDNDVDGAKNQPTRTRRRRKSGGFIWQR